MAGTHPYGVTGAVLRTETPRRRIEWEDVAFVRANRHRMGWQAMGKALGVNQHDLKRHCEKLWADPPPTPAPAPPAMEAKAGEAKPHRPTADRLKVLRAIHRGARTAADLAELCRCAPGGARDAIADLKASGWLAGYGGGLAGWVVTQAGLKALAEAGWR